MKQVQVNGANLNVFDQGTGRPILFVHGFPLDHRMWQAQLDSLSGEYRVIAPDLRGFGQSDVTEGTVTMEQMADDLAALLDALDIRNSIALCGLSMGGYVAFQFVRKYADRLHSLILCDTRAENDNAVAVAARRKMIQGVLTKGSEIVAQAMMPRLFLSSLPARRVAVMQRVREMIIDADPLGIAAALRGMIERPDATGQLSTISMPTLVIVGEEDQISPVEEMRRIAEAMPRAELSVIADAGHMSPMENPVAVNSALDWFLQQAGE